MRAVTRETTLGTALSLPPVDISVSPRRGVEP
jgi:hypothetical protein